MILRDILQIPAGYKVEMFVPMRIKEIENFNPSVWDLLEIL